MTGRMKRFFLLSILLIIFTGCGNKDRISISEAERDEGYILLSEYGIKYKVDEFKRYEKNISKYERFGDSKEDPLERQLIFDFLSDELIERYNEIENQDLDYEDKFEKFNEEVWEKTKPLMAFSIIKSKKLPKDERELKEITGFDFNKELGKSGGVVQYFSVANLNPSELSETSKILYERLLKAAGDSEETIIAAEPLSTRKSLGEIKDLKFSAEDLYGNHIDESFFKKSKFTVVNVWATWSDSSRHSLSSIALMSMHCESKGIKVLGIVADSEDKDINLSLAKQLLHDNYLSYPNLRNSPEIENKIISCIDSLPVIFFVDRNGNVVGDVLIGRRSENQWIEEVDKMLDKYE